MKSSDRALPPFIKVDRRKESDKRLEILKSDAADEYRKKVVPEKCHSCRNSGAELIPLFKTKRAARLSKLLKVKSFLNKLGESENAYQATQLLFNFLKENRRSDLRSASLEPLAPHQGWPT